MALTPFDGSTRHASGTVQYGRWSPYLRSEVNHELASTTRPLVRLALDANTSGTNNVALGYLAGSGITTGNYNIDIGNHGLPSSDKATIRIGTQGTQTSTFIAGIYGATVSAVRRCSM